MKIKRFNNLATREKYAKKFAFLRFCFISVVILAIFFLLVSPVKSFAQDDLRYETNRAFTYGEKLKFRIYYHSFVTGKLSAGYADFRIKKENIYGREAMHVIANGRTSKAFGWFYKIDDHYETYIDKRTLAPWKFIRRVNEGGYTIDHDTYFDQRKSKAYFRNNKNEKRLTLKTPKYVQDVLSLIYHARTLDYNEAKKGDVFKQKFMVDDTIYTARIKYVGKENISTELGKFQCIKIKPEVKIEGVFNEEDPMLLYVTDDKNRVPIFGESELKVGSMKLELIEFDGLRNYFSSAISWNK